MRKLNLSSLAASFGTTVSSRSARSTRQSLGLCAISCLVLPDVAPAEPIEFGSDDGVSRRIEITELDESVLRNAPERSGPGSFTINLNAGSGLLANPDALAAWNTVIALWESLLTDPITIAIDADFAVLDPSTILSTSQQLGSVGYDAARGLLIADGDVDETILGQLPTAAQLNLALRTGFTFSGSIAGSKANYFALGVDASGLTDPSVVFNSLLSSTFDYDPSNGIDAGKFDFQALVLREVGHLLGFVSVVQTIDELRDLGQTASVPIFIPDLFRMRPGDGALDFTNNPRIMDTGDSETVQMFFDGTQDLSLATGSVFGDGSSASHWKDDALTGSYIGIMDPTFPDGLAFSRTEADMVAFGLIGYDRVPSGACCDDFGGCQFFDREEDCTATGGTFLPGLPCEASPCFGACCEEEGACYLTFDEGCIDFNEQWQGYGTNCDPNPCFQPAGACCYFDGTCEVVPSSDYCDSSGELWQGVGSTCEPNPCDPAGACCLAGEVCNFYTLDYCLDGSGSWQGEGVPCDPNPCGTASAPQSEEFATVLSLQAPTPNPATTAISYGINLPEERRIQVDVLEVSGRVVGRPLDRVIDAGAHTFTWTAEDESGNKLASGVYYLRLQAGDVTQTRRFVLTR